MVCFGWPQRVRGFNSPVCYAAASPSTEAQDALRSLLSSKASKPTVLADDQRIQRQKNLLVSRFNQSKVLPSTSVKERLFTPIFREIFTDFGTDQIAK